MQKIEHLVSIKDVDRESIEDLLALAKSIESNPEQYSEECKGKILATIFFEPSTRTRLSFESSMLRLGGKVLGIADPMTSSVKKGESIADTIRMAASYSDIIVMRHKLEGAGKVASEFSKVPVISGGTGIQEHPTQALLDIFTIWKEFGKIDGLTIGLLGDLRFGRTVPSLLYALMKFHDVKVYLYSPQELRVRMTVLSDIDGQLSYTVQESLTETIGNLDVLYVTRVQQERFPDAASYERVKNFYYIDNEVLKLAKDNMIVMHPLPRVGEIAYEVDGSPHARYFQQAANGVWMRMAIIKRMLEARQ